MKLTDEETEVYDMVMDGSTDQDIADALEVKKSYVKNICVQLRSKVDEWPREDKGFTRNSNPKEKSVDAEAFYSLPPATVRYHNCQRQLAQAIRRLTDTLERVTVKDKPREQTIVSMNTIINLLDEAADIAGAIRTANK
jgi:hypothetical protein